MDASPFLLLALLFAIAVQWVELKHPCPHECQNCLDRRIRRRADDHSRWHEALGIAERDCPICTKRE